MAWSHLYVSFAVFLCLAHVCRAVPILGSAGEDRLNTQLGLLLNDIPPEWESERQIRIREALSKGRHIQPYASNQNSGIPIMSPTSGSFFYTMKAVARALHDLF